MDRDAAVRAVALAAIPLIAGGLYLARDRHAAVAATTSASAASAPPEPRGLGALAGLISERGEAALAEQKSASPSARAAPSAPPADAIAATNLPLADAKPTAPRVREKPARGACSGVEVRLITESDDPTWAFASLSPAAGERAVIRRVGESIGGMRVVKIEWDRVWLAGGGGRCAAAMLFGAREAAEADEGTPKRRRHRLPDELRAEKPWRLSGEMINGIEKLSESEFAVDRGLVSAIYSQAGSLLAGVKIEPVRDQDQVVGFELGEVRTDSLLERLGVETGDRVLSIDDTPARDLEALVGALGRAREKDRLIAKLERQGEAFSLRVTVR
ncbi:MAG: hypothetical protein IPI67_00215 [Myxococcales bacterium]|nr:hypothetical protein [Myxococcales bacterium]